MHRRAVLTSGSYPYLCARRCVHGWACDGGGRTDRMDISAMRRRRRYRHVIIGIFRTETHALRNIETVHTEQKSMEERFEFGVWDGRSGLVGAGTESGVRFVLDSDSDSDQG